MSKRKPKPFTEEELKIIAETPLRCIKDLAFKLNRDYDTVRKKKWMLEHPERVALAKDRYNNSGAKETPYNHCAWTRAEREIIMTSDKSDKDLSIELRRSISSIQQMRSRLKREAERKKKNGGNK